MTPTPRILIVEDDPDIRDLLCHLLSREPYELSAVADGEDAVAKIQSEKHDLYILDWMLPGLTGLQVTRLLRAINDQHQPPVLMVTARAAPEDIVTGLDEGADDYITKPFDPEILLARVRSLLRRVKSPEAQELCLGSIRLDADSQRAFVEDQPVHLTPYEYKLLFSLLQARGKVLTRKKLLHLVQGCGVTVVERAVDTHIFGLRKKLGIAGDFIETVRGVGYRVQVNA